MRCRICGTEFNEGEVCPRCGNKMNNFQGAPMNGNQMNNFQGAPMNGNQMNNFQGAPMNGNQMNNFQGTPMNGNQVNGSQEGLPKTKKIKLNTIIIIVVIVLVFIVVGIIISVFMKNNKKVGSTPTKSSQGNLAQKDDKWDNWELSIDGVSIKLPMRYNEFINKGFYIDKSESVYNIEYSELEATTRVGTSMKGKTTYTNGKTSGITLVVYNPSNEIIKIKDSYVVGIELEYGDDYSIGEIQLINNSRNTKVNVGKSTINEIEKAFGAHYQADHLNTFNYYPDLDKDGIISPSEVDINRVISLYCNEKTQILETYNFIYCDFGGDNYKWSIEKSSDSEWKIPTNFSYLKAMNNKTEQVYDNDQYTVHLLKYWKFDRDYNEITKYLTDKENYKGKGKIVKNQKYGNIFVLEKDKYNYEDKYSYYVITEDQKYFMLISSKATPTTTYKESGLSIVEWKEIYKNASKMETDDVIKLALEFLP